MIRTHEAGALRPSQAGQQVTLAGWVARRRDHGGVVFIDLRDASGVVQVVVRQEDVAHELRAEFCVQVTGEVRRRPAGNENPELPTGEVEVAAEQIEILAECDPLPFPIDGPAGGSGGTPSSTRKSGSGTGTWTSGGPTWRLRCAPGRPPPTWSAT